MILPVKQTLLTAALLLIFATTSPVFAAGATGNATPPAAIIDINKAQIAGQVAQNLESASITAGLVGSFSEIPLPVEIPAIDNLINASNASMSIPAVASLVSSVGNLLTSVGVASFAMPAVATPTRQAPVTASQSSEFIDTLYPDPLSPAFPNTSSIKKEDKTKTAEELIAEFNQQAAEIAARSGFTGSSSAPAPLPPPVSLATLPVTVAPPDSQATSAAFLSTQSREIPSKIAAPLTDEPPVASEPEVPDHVISESPVEETVASPAIPLETLDSIASAGIADFAPVATMTASPVVEIIPVSWPDSEQDPEFASGSTLLAVENASRAADLPGLFEKTAPLEPFLMTAGEPIDNGVDADKNQSLTGHLVPEKQPLGRRKYLYRWVLKTDDGRRIPLKSNLKLMTEVRRENILDGLVTLNGQYTKSGQNAELRYFTVESVKAAAGQEASATTDLAKVASGTVKLPK
ncbi:MAG TPA: hypothetical protein PKM56_03080 [Candidatus Rifleibacterium sp.]|nr:hypothetical protein [Candidatus Rifleibacterium sp.]